MHIRFGGGVPALLGLRIHDEDVEVPADSSLGDIADVLRLRGHGTLAFVVNGAVRGLDHLVQDGDEIVVLQPMAGG